MTHHEYIEVAASNALNASLLDASAAIAAEVVQVWSCPERPIPHFIAMRRIYDLYAGCAFG